MYSSPLSLDNNTSWFGLTSLFIYVIMTRSTLDTTFKDECQRSYPNIIRALIFGHFESIEALSRMSFGAAMLGCYLSRFVSLTTKRTVLRLPHV